MEVHIELIHGIEWYVHRLLRNKYNPETIAVRGAEGTAWVAREVLPPLVWSGLPRGPCAKYCLLTSYPRAIRGVVYAPVARVGSENQS